MARTEIAARLDGMELVRSFKHAINQREQVNILADLNCVAPRVIAELLHELGALEGAGLRVKDFSAHYVPVSPARTQGEPKAENHQRGRPRRNLDFTRVRQLYDEGYSDKAIGKEIGCADGTIYSWRKRNGLPPVSQKNTHQVGRPRKAWDLDLIRWCYDQGMSDESIAYEAGCSRGTVYNWRKRNSLPPVSQKKTGGAEDMAKFKLRETEETAIEREEEQERKFEAIVESVDAGKQQNAAQVIVSGSGAGGTGGNGRGGAGFWFVPHRGETQAKPPAADGSGDAPKALTVGGFLDAVRKYLTEATADAPLSINGEPVRGFGVEIAVRAEQVFVDVRTREASA